MQVRLITDSQQPFSIRTLVILDDFNQLYRSIDMNAKTLMLSLLVTLPFSLTTAIVSAGALTDYDAKSGVEKESEVFQKQQFEQTRIEILLGFQLQRNLPIDHISEIEEPECEPWPHCL
jgi:hypothetical protein